MARATFTISVDGDGTPDPVTVPVLCNYAYVWNDVDTTGNITQRVPLSTSTGITLAEGRTAVFYAGDGQIFQAGQVVGYLATVNAGPFTFNGRCE